MRRVLGAIVLGLACGSWAAGAFGAEAPAGGRAAPFRYEAKGRRDPFVPLVKDGKLLASLADASASRSTAMVLQGILWDPGGRSIALIGDTEATLGDTINGYQVVEIQRDSVVLSSGGERLVLQLQFETAPRDSSEDELGGAER